MGPTARPFLDRDNSDYVYRVEDLRTLRGKEYHGKRNFVRRFTDLYHPEVRLLTAAQSPECIHIQERWLEGQRNNESARDESTALIKVLRHFDDLGLRGVGVFAGESLVAFAMGEPLNTSTIVEHFEKALPGYTGAYQFLLQAFAKSIPEGFLLLNREQDLGIEGLRRATESWHPAQLVEKYTMRVCKKAEERPRESRAREMVGTVGSV